MENRARFDEVRTIVHRVHARLGIRREYTHKEYVADQHLIRDRSNAMRTRQWEENERIRLFESWEHGERLDQ
jgi:hypothetical protein